jgi:transcriptional regulator with XRE-family HTH domain
MASPDQTTRPPHGEIGTWLRSLRTERGLILREVAAAVDMDMAHLSKIELGDRLPTPEQASALAEFYAVCPNEMEGARMAARILRELRNHPAAPRVMQIVQESAAAYGIGKSAQSAHPRNPEI